MLDNDGNSVINEETGEPITTTKAGKNPLEIEHNDITGVLMACVQDLHSTTVKLESQIEQLQFQIKQLFFSNIKLQSQIEQLLSRD